MDRVYLIWGQSGDYSARAEWPVVVCLTKERADEVRNELADKVRQFHDDWDEMRKFDPGYCGNDGTEYQVCEIGVK